MSSELIELLELMLQFNPVFRPSASDLLKLPIFDNVRVPELEMWTGRKKRLNMKNTPNMQSETVEHREEEKDVDEATHRLLNRDLESWRQANLS